jgi:glycosyltransferase involved in cell wall biosynthesis
MEHFVVRLADAQRKLGHEASIVSMKPGPLCSEAVARGVPFTVLGDGRSGKRAPILRSLRELAGRRPDLIHVHNTTTLHYAVLGRLVSGARVVLTDHAQVGRVPWSVEWYLADAVVAVSRDTAAKSLANRVVREVRVIHNGIDASPPRRTREEVRAELGMGAELAAIQVGRFVPLKAQDVVVRAVASLKQRGEAMKVIFVGDGPERANVERLAGELGLGREHVRFLGIRADVPDLLGASDIFLLPSRTEGLPLSVLEAMTHHLAIVATPVGGVPEMCTDGEDALFVPVDDPARLADTLSGLAADPALRSRLGQAALTRAARDFSFAAMTQHYMAVYRDVLSRSTLDEVVTMIDRLRRRQAS